jgi:uncharacterized phage protein (TIGR01671 family)
MREIKFRAWIPDDAEMIPERKIISISSDAQTIQYFDSQGRHVHHGTNVGELDDTNPVNRAVVLQYTGLKDKNGVEIYEGDILRFKAWGGKHQGFVKWEEGTCAYEIEISRTSYTGFFRDPARVYEVVGNTYENPELLKDVA